MTTASANRIRSVLSSRYPFTVYLFSSIFFAKIMAPPSFLFFFFNDPAPPEISTLPLPAALPFPRLDARPAAERAALGPGRGAAPPRRAADGAAGGGARPGRPAHVRALVPAAGAALAAPLPRRRPRAARAPAAAGSGLHRRRRGPTALLRPDPDDAAVRPPGPWAYPGADSGPGRR